MWKLSADKHVAASQSAKPWTPLQQAERISTFNSFLYLHREPMGGPSSVLIYIFEKVPTSIFQNLKTCTNDYFFIFFLLKVLFTLSLPATIRLYFV